MNEVDDANRLMHERPEFTALLHFRKQQLNVTMYSICIELLVVD